MLCEAFPIRDLVSLSLYKEQGCSIISGDLYIIELPNDVLKDVLLDSLKTVRVIQGHLYVMHNEHLTAMTFFNDIDRVDGITFIDNPVLLNAHMHGLDNFDIPIVVEGCPRLCPARYTDKTESGEDESMCADPVIRLFLRVEGGATEEQLNVLGDLMTRVVRSTTQEEV